MAGGIGEGAGSRVADGEGQYSGRGPHGVRCGHGVGIAGSDRRGRARNGTGRRAQGQPGRQSGAHAVARHGSASAAGEVRRDGHALEVGGHGCGIGQAAGRLVTDGDAQGGGGAPNGIGGRDGIAGGGRDGCGSSGDNARLGVQDQTRRQGGSHGIGSDRSTARCGRVGRDGHALGVDRRVAAVGERTGGDVVHRNAKRHCRASHRVRACHGVGGQGAYACGCACDGTRGAVQAQAGR